MKGTSTRKLTVIAMVAAVIAGAGLAVAAVGEGPTRHAKHARARGHAIGPLDLAAASSYLGLSTAQIAADLQAGKTLADVASATPGKSDAGLEAALVVEKRNRLQTLAATLHKRVSAEVNRKAFIRALAGKRHRGAATGAITASDRLETLAAGYLGIGPAKLQQELQSGQTLAQVASATAGRSAVGLIGTLVLARREALALAVATHRITPARAAALSQRLVRRISATVNRRLSR
jgi:hypothetical protein